MKFFKALFGGKPSVEEKTLEYCDEIYAANGVGARTKAEKLEAELDKWYAGLSEDDKKKSDDAREKRNRERSEEIEKVLRESMDSVLTRFNDKMSELLDDEDEENPDELGIKMLEATKSLLDEED
jgi:hypothetical protein